MRVNLSTGSLLMNISTLLLFLSGGIHSSPVILHSKTFHVSFQWAKALKAQRRCKSLGARDKTEELESLHEAEVRMCMLAG